jgi:hypothetical protein
MPASGHQAEGQFTIWKMIDVFPLGIIAVMVPSDITSLAGEE